MNIEQPLQAKDEAVGKPQSFSVEIGMSGEAAASASSLQDAFLRFRRQRKVCACGGGRGRE